MLRIVQDNTSRLSVSSVATNPRYETHRNSLCLSRPPLIQALAGIPEDERCSCEHTPVEGNPRMSEVKKKETKE